LHNHDSPDQHKPEEKGCRPTTFGHLHKTPTPAQTEHTNWRAFALHGEPPFTTMKQTNVQTSMFDKLIHIQNLTRQIQETTVSGTFTSCIYNKKEITSTMLWHMRTQHK
jgi:hypothetical protein